MTPAAAEVGNFSQPCPGFFHDGRRVSSSRAQMIAPAAARLPMRHILTVLALASWVGLAAFPAVAQTQPEPGKKDAPPATTAPQPAAPPPAAKKAAEPATTVASEGRKRRVGKAGHRRHAHATRRHRAARHHRHGWRNVWIYRAHDRHGHRHYEYVSRKFGGYFARGRADCGCRRAAQAHRRWHL
jgi:hypothetical protein